MKCIGQISSALELVNIDTLVTCPGYLGCDQRARRADQIDAGADPTSRDWKPGYPCLNERKAGLG